MRDIVVVLVLSLSAGTVMAEIPLHPAAQIAAAEIAFARQSVEQGLNTAFAANFADDAVDFAPFPREEARQYYVGQPNPPVVLDWYPAWTLAAASGDFGVSTGPFELSDPSGEQPSRHGHYISIWRKQATGEWQVMLDGGVFHPRPEAEIAPLRPLDMPARQLVAQPAWQGTSAGELVEEDRAFSKHAAEGLACAFAAVADDEVRFYRNGHVPLSGKTSVIEFLERSNEARSWEPHGAAIAGSGDLGFTYGSSSVRRDGKFEQGAYLRVWQRSSSGWKVIVDRDLVVPQPGQG